MGEGERGREGLIPSPRRLGRPDPKALRGAGGGPAGTPRRPRGGGGRVGRGVAGGRWSPRWMGSPKGSEEGTSGGRGGGGVGWWQKLPCRSLVAPSEERLVPGCEAEQWGRPARKKMEPETCFPRLCRSARCLRRDRPAASSARDGNMEVELHTDKGRSIQMCSWGRSYLVNIMEPAAGRGGGGFLQMSSQIWLVSSEEASTN